jgi:hypothetical protein
VAIATHSVSASAEQPWLAEELAGTERSADPVK